MWTRITICDKKIKEEYGQLQFCFQKGLKSEVIVLVTEIAAALLSYEAQCYLFHSSILQNRKQQLAPPRLNRF